MRDAIRARVGKFVSGLSPALRAEILRVDSGTSSRKMEFLTEVVDVLPSTTVVEVLGNLDSAGARVPHQFITLMNKLIHLSASNPALRTSLGDKLAQLGVPSTVLDARPEEARAVLSEVMQRRVDKDYNPAHYQALLEDLSARRVEGSPTFTAGVYGDPRASDEVRAHLAEIALRLLVAQPGAPEATGYVRCLDEDAPRALEAGRFEQVHDAASSLRELTAQSEALPAELRELSESYLAGFTKEERIERILCAAAASPGPLPEHIIGLFRIAGREAGFAAMQRLAALAEGGQAPEAERLRELMVRLDPDELNAVVARLRAEGWMALRPLFPVLQRLGGSRAVDLALTFVGNEDPRIRTEALRVLLAADDRPGQAERYIERGLFDEAPSVIAFTLGQARARRSPEVTALLGAFVSGEREARDDELRIRAISILGSFGTPAARDILVPLLAGRKVALFVAQVRIAQALEEALVKIGDEAAMAAVKKWRRSPARWISILLVKGKVEKRTGGK